MRIYKGRLTAMALAAMLLVAGTQTLRAQDAGLKQLTLWVDQKTGQVFIRPGTGRVQLVLPAAALGSSESEKRVEQKTARQIELSQQELRAELLQSQQQLAAKNAEIEKQVKEIQPDWADYVHNWKKRFKITTLLYADWRLYTHSGFGPQEFTQINRPGPGNDIFNSFDITRTYLNFFFYPADGWEMRITPNIYRQLGSAGPATYGKNSAVASNLNGQLGFRLKYAYLTYKKAFDGIEPIKGGTIGLGQIMNPLVDWEERLYNFRYVNLTPWNYLSLSSTHVGMKVAGPLQIGGTKYADYDVGVFNNPSFASYDQTNTKQVMGRVSVYPLGGTGNFNGLGFTGFYDYGYGNTTPDFVGSAPLFNAPKAHITRVALFAHYRTDDLLLAGEWDYGHNAFTNGNLFSGAGPASTGTFADFALLSQTLLNNGRSVQQGFDFFGFYHIPNTPLTLFGTFMWFQPNTKVDLNPLDFQRWVAGLSYRYNEYLRFAFSSQNLLYYHGQFDFPVAYANTFAPTDVKGSVVRDAVPRDVHGFFLNLELNY